jgi:hypothetical protein
MGVSIDSEERPDTRSIVQCTMRWLDMRKLMTRELVSKLSRRISLPAYIASMMSLT